MPRDSSVPARASAITCASSAEKKLCPSGAAQNPRVIVAGPNATYPAVCVTSSRIVTAPAGDPFQLREVGGDGGFQTDLAPLDRVRDDQTGHRLGQRSDLHPRVLVGARDRRTVPGWRHPGRRSRRRDRGSRRACHRLRSASRRSRTASSPVTRGGDLRRHAERCHAEDERRHQHRGERVVGRARTRRPRQRPRAPRSNCRRCTSRPAPSGPEERPEWRPALRRRAAFPGQRRAKVLVSRASATRRV